MIQIKFNQRSLRLVCWKAQKIVEEIKDDLNR